MRSLAFVALVSVLSGVAVAKPRTTSRHRDSSHSPTRHEYVKQTFGPRSALSAGAGAGVAQFRNTPREWGQGGTGFGKRLASGFGKHVVNNTIRFGVASWRHEEVGYRPSGKSGFGPRMKHALVSTVVTRKTTTGKRTVASGEIAGAFGSGMISRAWQPASTRTVGAGLASGGATLGIDASTHVVREFWPEIRHPRRHHRR